MNGPAPRCTVGCRFVVFSSRVGCTLLLTIGRVALLTAGPTLLLAVGPALALPAAVCTLLATLALWLTARGALAIALVQTLMLWLGLPTISRLGLNLKVRLENLVSLWRRVFPAKLIGRRRHEGRSGELPSCRPGGGGGISASRARRIGFQLLPLLEVLAVL